MISVPYTWTGIIIEQPGQIPYHPPTIDNQPATYITTEDPNGRYQNTTVTVEYNITAEEEVVDEVAQTRAKRIAVALTHNESMAVPYTVYHRITGEVIYRSNKTEFKIDENNRCPICFSQIKTQNGTGIQTWDNDPIKTPNGLAGERFQGFQQIALSDIADIQERNIALGMVGTKFESYTNPDGIVISKRPVQVSDIIDLREGTESIIGSGSTAKSNYFKYDERGNDTGSTQSDWTDPQLVANTFSVRALHVEDLRHPLLGLELCVITRDYIDTTINTISSWVGGNITNDLTPARPSDVDLNGNALLNGKLYRIDGLLPKIWVYNLNSLEYESSLNLADYGVGVQSMSANNDNTFSLELDGEVGNITKMGYITQSQLEPILIKEITWTIPNNEAAWEGIEFYNNVINSGYRFAADANYVYTLGSLVYSPYKYDPYFHGQTIYGTQAILNNFSVTDLNMGSYVAIYDKYIGSWVYEDRLWSRTVIIPHDDIWFLIDSDRKHPNSIRSINCDDEYFYILIQAVDILELNNGARYLFDGPGQWEGWVGGIRPMVVDNTSYYVLMSMKKNGTSQSFFKMSASPLNIIVTGNYIVGVSGNKYVAFTKSTVKSSSESLNFDNSSSNVELPSGTNPYYSIINSFKNKFVD